MKALVTGHTSGIGEALCNLLIEKGYSVDGLSLREGYDVSNVSTWDGVINSGKIYDIVVLNAGVCDFEENVYSCERIVRSNILGVAYGLYSLGYILREKGTAVVIASVSGTKLEADVPVYGASKAAVIYLARAFAKKYKGRYRIFAVSPGFVSGTRLGMCDRFAAPEDVPESLLSDVWENRAMTPREIAEYVWKFIEVGYLTGVDIIVDGGYSLD